MEIILELAKWFLAKSDPMLIVCFLVLALWQHRTSKLLAAHLDQNNKNPHPQCPVHAQAFQDLREKMDTNHAETREDIQGLSERIDTVLQIAVEKDR